MYGTERQRQECCSLFFAYSSFAFFFSFLVLFCFVFCQHEKCLISHFYIYMFLYFSSFMFPCNFLPTVFCLSCFFLLFLSVYFSCRCMFDQSLTFFPWFSLTFVFLLQFLADVQSAMMHNHLSECNTDTH